MFNINWDNFVSMDNFVSDIYILIYLILVKY